MTFDEWKKFDHLIALARIQASYGITEAGGMQRCDTVWRRIDILYMISLVFVLKWSIYQYTTF